MGRSPFIPAKPAQWFIRTVQTYVRAELALTNRLHLDEEALEVLRKIPPDSGVILTSNHADETDPRVCFELSRRARKQFICMCNREAFDEIGGLAGWALQRLGLFSVERGAHDLDAKNFATNVVMQGKDVLVIFPEGEIFYLNEVVRPFHSGAIDICLQAIVEKRKSNPDWTAYIVPMGIKYHYEQPIVKILDKRVSKMEAMLSLPASNKSLQTRIFEIQTALLRQHESKHSIERDALIQQQMTQEIIAAKNAILLEVESKHVDMPLSEQGKTIDKAWRLGAEIRQKMSEVKDRVTREELKQDLDALSEVAHMSSWQPRYYSESQSQDRLAEAVMKLERELFKIKRPKQLANRNVLVKLADPIDMGPMISDYLQDARSVRHRVTKELHGQIQSLVDGLTARAADL